MSMAKCKLCGERVVSGIVAHDECLPRWIPVTERLPTKEDADKHGRVWAIHKRFHSDAWNWETVRDYPEEFTHWMHLPAHPEVTV